MYPYEKKNVPAKQEKGKNFLEKGLCCKVLVKLLNRSALMLTVESGKKVKFQTGDTESAKKV